MPIRAVAAAANNTELQNIINAALASGNIAPFAYETDTQTLYLFDPLTDDYYGIPMVAINGLIGLTATAAELNALTGGTNAVPGGAGALPTAPQVAYARWNFATDGGAISTITPAVNSTIPANAIITRAFFNSVVAPVGTGAHIEFGTAAGSSTTGLLGSTAITSFTLDAIVLGAVNTTPIKLTAAGQITMTILTDALTAGEIEIFVEYVIPANA
jgi:hypothetical protein